MDIRVALSKVIALIYRARLVGNLDNDDLIRTVLQGVKTDSPEVQFGSTNQPKKLKDLCLELLEDKEPIAKEVLLPRLTLILEHDQKLFQSVKESIDPDYDEAVNKRVITSLVKHLHSYYREQKATDYISKVGYEIKFNRSKIGNFNDYLRGVVAELEPLTYAHAIKDDAIVTEIDFEDQDSISRVMDELKVVNSNKGVYRFGWQDLNIMSQGGGRRGETVTIGALQHKYKTGFSMSVYCQIATLNSPIIFEGEEGKKPLLLRISFEDSAVNNVQFLYQYLKAVDGEIIKPEDLVNLDSNEMSAYVRSKLTATGFSVKTMRVDPSRWTYSSVINKILEYEAQGYQVHLLMLDYVTLLPTTGCVQGPAGTDKKDLLRRIRNFCSARKILFITPLQLSSEAKQLLRNGIPEWDFVNQVAEKGYYDGTKTIDQDIDLELFIHLFTHKRKKYLAVRRGKHRLPTVIDDEEKYFILPFPGLNVPILEDVNTDKRSFRKMPRDYGSDSANVLEDVFA